MKNLNNTTYLKNFIKDYWKENIENKDYINDFIDGEVFIYNHDLMSWLTKNFCYYQDKIDEWLIVFTKDFIFTESIRIAQYFQIEEDFLEELTEYLENIWQE